MFVPTKMKNKSKWFVFFLFKRSNDFIYFEILRKISFLRISRVSSFYSSKSSIVNRAIMTQSSQQRRSREFCFAMRINKFVVRMEFRFIGLHCTKNVLNILLASEIWPHEICNKWSRLNEAFIINKNWKSHTVLAPIDVYICLKSCINFFFFYCYRYLLISAYYAVESIELNPSISVFLSVYR